MSRKDVLVVIVSTNDGRWLRACFDALAQSRYKGFETLLVLNDCADDSQDESERAPLSVRVARTNVRCGFAEANNIGIRQAVEDGFRYVFLLNPDTKAHPDAILELKTFLDRTPTYGIVGSQQVLYDSSDWVERNRWMRETLAVAQTLGQSPTARGEWTVVDHYYVQGAALMMRADLVPFIGMLDPLYGTFYEETDLCRRCLLAGHRVGLVLESRIKHYEGGHWRRTRTHHLRRDVLFLRNQFLYFMSASESLPKVVLTGIALLYQQLRGFREGEHDICLRWWQYPVVLAKLALAIRFLPRLRRRNASIRAKSILATSEYAIGPIGR